MLEAEKVALRNRLCVLAVSLCSSCFAGMFLCVILGEAGVR